MTPQELKASILQMAIQGKLVEQRPEEGTGEKLYQQIQTEKQALIKSGKIKKEKSLPEITEDEIPFDIPENWIWVRVAQIVALNPKNDLDDNVETSFIPMPCIMDGFRNQHTFEIKKWKEIKKGFTHFAEGDIGVAKITPCFQNRKSVVFQNLNNGYGAGTTELSVVRTINDTVLREFLLWFFKTEYFIANGVKSFTGTAGQQRIHKDYLATCPIPLPPLAEQKRIVAKIEELLPYIDRYEQAWSRLEDFNKRFPVDMQKSILQMAIQGKLLPQLPEEGTGDELFQQIQAEKQVLIKAGTIKKEKPMPEIAEDEIPFDIPESWKWVRVGDYVQKVTDYVASGSFASLRENVKIYKEPNYAILVKTKDFQSNFTNDLTYTDKHGYEFLENSRLFGGELIMPNIGASIGKVFKVPYLDAKMTLAPNSVLIRFVSEEHLDWFSYYFASPIGFAQLKTISASTAQAKFSKTEFKGLLIPVPPLAEQKRIVAKLEEILPLCERLK